MDVEKYSHVMHIVSQVEGRLRADCDAYDALRSCFPAGTVSGAPKIRAMEIIAELEPCRRGTYAGAVGYFSFDGNLDTAITIRTMVIKDGVAHVQAGGGRGGRLPAGVRVPGIAQQGGGAAALARCRRRSGRSRGGQAMIVVLDNYDSFTYNLVQYLGELGETLAVYRNDKIYGGGDRARRRRRRS